MSFYIGSMRFHRTFCEPRPAQETVNGTHPHLRAGQFFSEADYASFWFFVLRGQPVPDSKTGGGAAGVVYCRVGHGCKDSWPLAAEKIWPLTQGQWLVRKTHSLHSQQVDGLRALHCSRECIGIAVGPLHRGQWRMRDSLAWPQVEFCLCIALQQGSALTAFGRRVTGAFAVQFKDSWSLAEGHTWPLPRGNG